MYRQALRLIWSFVSPKQVAVLKRIAQKSIGTEQRKRNISNSIDNDGEKEENKNRNSVDRHGQSRQTVKKATTFIVNCACEFLATFGPGHL